jgi:O-antigen/teichoic acid export membrane protein
MFIIQPLSIIISIIIARELGASGKGIYAFLLVLMSFCTPFFLFGFDSATYYYLSTKTYKIQDIFFTVVLISFTLGIFTSFCLYFIIQFELFGSVLNDLKNRIIILYLCTIPFLFIYHLCQRSLMATSNY